MQAVQAMNRGQGGWPMTVFMLPDGRPFFGGTYYPRESRMGMPSFRQVLQAVQDAYTNKRDELEEQAGNLATALDRTTLNIDSDATSIQASLLDTAREKLLQNFDATYGGFGQAPKFPNPMNLEYLLRDHQRSSHAQDRKSVV